MARGSQTGTITVTFTWSDPRVAQLGANAVLQAFDEARSASIKAQGDATAIRVIAEATAAGVRSVAEAIGDKGGIEAANLKVAQQYIDAFANLAKQSNTLIIPANASDIGGFVAAAMTVLDKARLPKAPGA